MLFNFFYNFSVFTKSKSWRLLKVTDKCAYKLTRKCIKDYTLGLLFFYINGRIVVVLIESEKII